MDTFCTLFLTSTGGMLALDAAVEVEFSSHRPLCP